jgi:16S rRNA (guanine527-N7)-methyltransferase
VAFPDDLLSRVSTYLDLLLRWNTRTNLTGIRSPEEIVTRHFGESFFAAQQILRSGNSAERLADVGSGAGFPGVPIKLWLPELYVCLVESHQKKVTFLRETIRALGISDIEVKATRAEQISQTFDIVTVRAVERFGRVLPVAAKLLSPGGRLVLLIGEDQVSAAKAILPALGWENPYLIPNSQNRVVFMGTSAEE